MTTFVNWLTQLLQAKNKWRYKVVIIQPANLRLSNRGTIASNFKLQIISGTPTTPGPVLHTENGNIIANSQKDFALSAWADVPVGFAGFAKLESDQKLGFITFILASVVDCTIRDVAGVGGKVTITFLAGNDSLMPTYEVTLPPGGSYVCTAAEFPAPAYTNRVMFSAQFGLTFYYETVVEGLAK